MPKPFAATSLSPGCGHEPQEHQVHEAQTSWKRAWADRSQASAQSGAGLRDSRGPEDAAAPQKNTERRAAEPWAQLLGLEGPRTTMGQPRETQLGQAKAGRWTFHVEREVLSFSAAQLSKILKTGVQKTPEVNQRSTTRQDRVELPPSDPGLSLLHHHPAKCWPGVPHLT